MPFAVCQLSGTFPVAIDFPKIIRSNGAMFSAIFDTFLSRVVLLLGFVCAEVIQ